jgi:hypothetical protein
MEIRSLASCCYEQIFHFTGTFLADITIENLTVGVPLIELVDRFELVFCLDNNVSNNSATCCFDSKCKTLSHVLLSLGPVIQNLDFEIDLCQSALRRLSSIN